MKYDFDHVINRKLGKCRKWDNTILKEKFGLNEDAIPMDLADLILNVHRQSSRR